MYGEWTEDEYLKSNRMIDKFKIGLTYVFKLI